MRYRQHRGGAESNLTQAVEQSAETGGNADTAAVQSAEEDAADAEKVTEASSELQTEEEQQETSEEETTEEAAGEETEAADDVPEAEEAEDPVSESSAEQDENGDVSEEETEAGWITNEDGSYSYRDADGELLTDCVAEIDGKYYGFDHEGKMQVDTIVWAYSDEGELARYYAGQDGSLKTNSWVKYSGDWYYFGEDGAGYEGVHTIAGKMYYFNAGLMAAGKVVNDGETNYIAQDDGTLREMQNDTWVKANGKWFYQKDGTVLKECVEKIGNAYYGFDEYGQMYENKYFSLDEGFYDENGEWQRKEKRYLAKTGGALMVNSWKLDGEYWHYFGADAEMAEGIRTINGSRYYFVDGIMQTHGVVEEADTIYLVKSDGKLTVNKNGWLKQGESWYYAKDNSYYKNTVVLINGKSYGFDENGRMRQNEVAVYDGKNYIADANGYLREMKEGWSKVGQNWYYVRDGKLLTGTFATIGNDRYYFYDSGCMAPEGTELLLGYEGQYIVGKDGKIQKNKMQEAYKGIYYCNEDGKSVDGITEINGNKYWFNCGWMCTVGYTQIDGENYVIGADGKLVKLSYKGWNKVGENWYYVDENGEMVKDGAYKIGDKTYVFSKYGKMLTSKNGVQINDEILYHVYSGPAAAEDGTLLKNTWIKIKDYDALDDKTQYYWQYYDGNGKRVYGLITLGGKKYFIGDCLYTDTTYKSYIADSNGVLHEAKKDGWYKIGKYWYYRANGVFVTSAIRKIGNTYYAFDYDGHMYENQTFEEQDKYGRTVYYRASASGSLIRNTSWKDTNGDVYYYDADGIGYEGTRSINGVTCYFENGKLLRNAAVYDSYGTRYIIDSKGNMRKMANNQWSKVDGFWYYAQDGMILKNTTAKINGKYYGFDAQGRMYENTTFVLENFYLDKITYYASKDGVLLTDQQYKLGKDTYCFDAYGRGYEGRHWVNGKSCFFRNGKLIG